MLDPSGSFILGDRPVHRMGYGAMQLAEPGVFGLPRDRDIQTRRAAQLAS